MVTIEPYFCYVLEIFICSNFIRRQVIVIIDNGHFLSKLMIKLLSSLAVKQKIFIKEFSHMTN